MNYFWKELQDMIWRIDIITHEFWWPYPHGNEPNMDRSVLHHLRFNREPHSFVLFCRLFAQFLPVAATFSETSSRNKHEDHKKKIKTSADVHLSQRRGASDGNSMQSEARMNSGWTDRIPCQKNQNKNHVAPVGQRPRLPRSRRLFTFNRTFLCTSDEKSS